MENQINVLRKIDVPTEILKNELFPNLQAFSNFSCSWEQWFKLSTNNKLYVV